MEISVHRDEIVSRLKLKFDNNTRGITANELDEETNFYYSIINDLDNGFQFLLGKSEKYTHCPANRKAKIPFDNDEGYFIVFNQDRLDFAAKYASRYFSQIRYRTPQLDWLYTDILLIGAIDLNKKKLSDEPMEKAFPELAATIEKFVDKGFLSILPSLLWFFVKWLILISIFILLTFSAFKYPFLGLFAAGMLGYKVYNLSRQRNIWNNSATRVTSLFRRMDSTYNLLEEFNYDRVLLKDDLLGLKKDGLYIPGPLWSACKPITHNPNSA